jgi:hypothetical protein
VSDRLGRRAREARSRAVVRAWEYRQRRLAGGVWFRLRRVLTEAQEAYAISEEAAKALIAEGHRPEPVGAELEPPRTILFVDPGRLAAIPDRQRLAVRLSAQLLSARWVVLIRFPEPSPLATTDPGGR